MIIPAIEMILNELDEGDLALVLRNIIKERFAYLKLDKFFWIANCLGSRTFAYISFAYITFAYKVFINSCVHHNCVQYISF